MRVEDKPKSADTVSVLPEAGTDRRPRNLSRVPLLARSRRRAHAVVGHRIADDQPGDTHEPPTVVGSWAFDVLWPFGQLRERRESTRNALRSAVAEGVMITAQPTTRREHPMSDTRVPLK
ncbi:hypothetical protein ACVB8X_31485, partial [Streptomyces sp. NRAIS4]